MHGKWSTTIVEELMEVAGGNSWQLWKAEATASGHPIVPSEDFEDKKKAKNKTQRSPAWKKPSFKQEFIQLEPSVAPSRSNQESSTSRPKTGAAAVLP
jgi:small subunit ribosomal protein S25